VLTNEAYCGILVWSGRPGHSAIRSSEPPVRIENAGQPSLTARLSRLYDALETGEIELDDLAPRIRELKARQNELTKARVQAEAEMIAQGIEQVDIATVKAYAQDLRGLLQEADFTERKAFLHSFIKRIEVNKEQVTVYYKLPMPQDGKLKEQIGVLPIDTLGGAGVTIGRTFKLAFSLTT
jgi:site-specific DNA recombinase